MTAREQAIADGYEVDAYGIITNPGRFEGEHVSTYAAHEAMMDGDGEIVGGDTLILTTDRAEADNWGLRQDEIGVLVSVTDSGFVLGFPVTRAEADRLLQYDQ